MTTCAIEPTATDGADGTGAMSETAASEAGDVIGGPGGGEDGELARGDEGDADGGDACGPGGDGELALGGGDERHGDGGDGADAWDGKLAGEGESGEDGTGRADSHGVDLGPVSALWAYTHGADSTAGHTPAVGGDRIDGDGTHRHGGRTGEAAPGPAEDAHRADAREDDNSEDRLGQVGTGGMRTLGVGNDGGDTSGADSAGAQVPLAGSDRADAQEGDGRADGAGPADARWADGARAHNHGGRTDETAPGPADAFRADAREGRVRQVGAGGTHTLWVGNSRVDVPGAANPRADAGPVGTGPGDALGGTFSAGLDTPDRTFAPEDDNHSAGADPAGLGTGHGSRWDPVPHTPCVITADGAYAARLARDPRSDAWFPERWTLGGPEPYAVPLPVHQPEEPGTEVQPMGDGRVLVRRVTQGRHAFSLLYPTGPGTGELPLGAVECPDDDTRLRLLPPAPCGQRAYALAAGRYSTAVWLVAGGGFGPEHVAEIPGRCSGGVWLDRTGRMLALDREVAGRTKSLVVDLERGGEVTPLLQITAGSDDRLLLADMDSGLVLISSDAPSPGTPRLGWGVLGSTLPVRFPESLRLPGCTLTPFAIQPGQILLPELCAVALRIDGPYGTWVGSWRPAERRLHQLAAPEGWLAGSGRWTPDGVLRLPYATGTVPCGVAHLTPPIVRPPDERPPVTTPAARPVPLQQAPLDRLVTK